MIPQMREQTDHERMAREAFMERLRAQDESSMRPMLTETKNPAVIRSAQQVLAEMGFEPMVEAVNLFRRAKDEEKWKECRMILHDILEFSTPKLRSTDMNVNVKGVHVIYQDELPEPQRRTIEGNDEPS